MIIFFVNFTNNNFFSLFFNIFSIIYIKLAHSFGKLVVITTTQKHSNFFDKCLLLLIIKIFYIGWICSILIERLFYLYKKYSKIETMILESINQYKGLMIQKNYIIKNPNEKSIQTEEFESIDSKLEFIKRNYHLQFDENELQDYFHLKNDFLFSLKSMLSIVLFFSTNQIVLFFVPFELILSLLYFKLIFWINRPLWWIALMKMATNLWYLLFLVSIIVTKNFYQLDPGNSGYFFNLFILKYYFFYFISFFISNWHANRF